MYSPSLPSWLGGIGAGSMNKEFARGLRDRAQIHCQRLFRVVVLVTEDVYNGHDHYTSLQRAGP